MTIRSTRVGRQNVCVLQGWSSLANAVIKACAGKAQGDFRHQGNSKQAGTAELASKSRSAWRLGPRMDITSMPQRRKCGRSNSSAFGRLRNMPRTCRTEWRSLIRTDWLETPKAERGPD